MFVKISKQEARRRFGNGETIILCPRKLRPGFPFAPHVYVSGAKWKEQEYGKPDAAELWRRMYNSFCFYNSSWEAGYYPHYYIEYDKPPVNPER